MRILDVESLAVARDEQPAGCEGIIGCVACSPCGEWLAVGCGDGAVRLLNADSLAVLHEKWLGYGKILSVAYPPSGGQLAVACWDEHLCVLEASLEAGSLAVLREERPAGGRIGAVAYSPSGERLAAGDDNGTVRVLGAGSLELLQEIRWSDPPPPSPWRTRRTGSSL